MLYPDDLRNENKVNNHNEIIKLALELMKLVNHCFYGEIGYEKSKRHHPEKIYTLNKPESSDSTSSRNTLISDTKKPLLDLHALMLGIKNFFLTWKKPKLLE